MSICGGVSSIIYPEMFISLSRARMASPTGQCQAFSANADGYARGEGCGIVILEKYSEVNIDIFHFIFYLVVVSSLKLNTNSIKKMRNDI